MQAEEYYKEKSLCGYFEGNKQFSKIKKLRTGEPDCNHQEERAALPRAQSASCMLRLHRLFQYKVLEAETQFSPSKNSRTPLVSQQLLFTLIKYTAEQRKRGRELQRLRGQSGLGLGAVALSSWLLHIFLLGIQPYPSSLSIPHPLTGRKRFISLVLCAYC